MANKKDSVETIGGLPTTGDINMNDNHILTSADPTENSHLARKKYVDDVVGSGGGGNLSKTGGVMTGNIYMGNYKIFTNVDPTDEKCLTRKKYVDTEDAKKLSLTGGKMTGNIDIGNNKIVTTSHSTDDNHSPRKKDVGFSILKDNFSLKFHNLFLVEYDSAYDLLFLRNGGKVKELVDYGIEGNNFKQTTKSFQPTLCLENEKMYNKYYLKFSNNRMISDSNINPVTGKKIYYKCFCCLQIKFCFFWISLVEIRSIWS